MNYISKKNVFFSKPVVSLLHDVRAIFLADLKEKEKKKNKDIHYV